MPRNGTTVLLGAGFSQSMHLPSTLELTQIVKAIKAPSISLGVTEELKEVPLADMLWRMISSYYETPNFETMLHGIEAMLSVQAGVVGVNLSDARKPAVNAFMDITPRWVPLVRADALMNLATRIISTVADTLVQRRAPLDLEKGAFATNRDALAVLGAHRPLTIANLNYDDTAYLMFPQLLDGFGADSDAGADFDYRNLAQDDSGDRILHLHGSVRYRLTGTSDTQEPGETQPRKRRIVKFARVEDAQGGWEAIDDIGSQSGERVLVGPIITGLRKAEKTLYPPYGYYLHEFVRALLESPRLVLAGYGGSDAYINHWIMQWLLYHGANARLIMITKADFSASVNTLSALDLASKAFGLEPGVLAKELPLNATVQRENGLVYNGGFPIEVGRSEEMRKVLS